MSVIIESIVTQHAEEAAFLWLLREEAIRAPHYNLKDLADHDERVEAHIDGLRIAGEPGWEICKEQLKHEEPGEVFAASVIAFESGHEAWIDAVLEVGASSVELSRGVVAALGWLAFEKASPHIARLLSESSPVLQHIGLAATAIHRQDPADALAAAIQHEDAVVRVRAVKAVGELGRVDLVKEAVADRDDDDAQCRYFAAWAAARCGQVEAIATLQDFAGNGGPLAEQANVMALRCMPLKEAHAWLGALAKRAEAHRLAVQSVGVLGDPVSMPWLLEQMGVPEVARVAGESFSRITGVDLAYDDLDGDWPEGFEAGPTEDLEDENVEMDADEDLPWPNQALLQKWWNDNRQNYQNGTRYLCGHPMTTDSLNAVLRTGYQRQRIAAAIELAIRQPNTPLFETRAPGKMQKRQLRF